MPILIYIAGPFTSAPEENTRKAIDVADVLWRRGFVPFVPHLNLLWNKQHPDHLWREWIELDLHWLRKCDVMFRMPGESKGADIEEEEAQRLGIPIFRNLDTLTLMREAAEKASDILAGFGVQNPYLEKTLAALERETARA